MDHDALCDAAKEFLLPFYLDHASRMMLGCALPDKACASHFRAAVSALNGYRNRGHRDAEFLRLADSYASAFPNLSRFASDMPLSLKNIGLLLSDSNKDLKFLFKIMRTFCEKSYPLRGGTRKSVAIPLPSQAFSGSNPLFEASAAKIGSAPDTTIHAKGIMLKVPPYNDRLTTACFRMLLFGPQAHDFFFGDEPIHEHGPTEKEMEMVLSAFPLSLKYVPLCETSYQALASRIALRQLFPDCDKDNMEHLVSKQILSAFRHAEIAHDNLPDLLASEREKTAALQRELAELHACLSKTSESDLATEQEHAEALAKLKKRMKTLSARVDWERERNCKLQNEAQQLSQKLQRIMAENDSLKSQLEAASESTGSDDAREAELEETPITGIPARLGFDTIQRLANRRILVVGGHTNTHCALRKHFPN